MTYGFFVKADNNIPIERLEKFYQLTGSGSKASACCEKVQGAQKLFDVEFVEIA